MNPSPSADSPPVISDVAALRQRIAQARAAAKSIGLVPTMGALHQGHLSLVERARCECGFVVVTIFVNPKQFAPTEDYLVYPRTLEADCRQLARREVDLVFAPSSETMYGEKFSTYVTPGDPAVAWEGAARPGHFMGVATVVLKLFNQVQADRAYFGRKDYQQTCVVRRMVEDLDLPIEIVVCPTVREPDGLAMSSRNVYLSADERRRALAISASLQLAKELVQQGTLDAAVIRSRMFQTLQAADLKIDYVAIVDPQTLEPVADVAAGAVALIAARAGKTRLIDNESLG